MKSLLIASVLASMLSASESSAQVISPTPTGPDTFRVRTVYPARPKVDTAQVKVIRGNELSEDTAAILLAADTGGVPAWVSRVVGDTAWVEFRTSRTTKVDTLRPAPDVLAIYENKTWDRWETRVEKRNGKWVQVFRKKLQEN